MTASNFPNEEKYFAAILGKDGGIELVSWFTTRKEAKAETVAWRKAEKDQFYRKDIFYGKVLA